MLRTLDQIDRYQIEGSLGRGSFGTVFRARHIHTHQTVALKVVRDADERALRHLVREAQVLATVDHPNVIRVFDAGVVPGAAFVAMELVAGETLEQLLTRERALRWSAAVGIASQLLHGLAAVHACGVIHRDVKPSNLMVLPTGMIKLVDFGISRSEQVQVSEVSAQRWQGTPGYMAPEQFTSGVVDFRADIYSAGATIYRMLAGERPFPETDLAQLLLRVARDRAPSLGTRTREVPMTVISAVDRALARDPDARFASATEFARALGDSASGPLPAFATDATAPHGPPSRTGIAPPPGFVATEARDYAAGGHTPMAHSAPPHPLHAPPARRSAAPWILATGLLGLGCAAGLAAVWLAMNRDTLQSELEAGRPEPTAPAAASGLGAVPPLAATSASATTSQGPRASARQSAASSSASTPNAPVAPIPTSATKSTCLCNVANEAYHGSLCRSRAASPSCRCQVPGPTLLCPVPWVQKGNDVVCPSGSTSYRAIAGASPGGACQGYDASTDRSGKPTSPLRSGSYDCYFCETTRSFSGPNRTPCSGIHPQTAAPMSGYLVCE